MICFVLVKTWLVNFYASVVAVSVTAMSSRRFVQDCYSVPSRVLASCNGGVGTCLWALRPYESLFVIFGYHVCVRASERVECNLRCGITVMSPYVMEI